LDPAEHSWIDFEVTPVYVAGDFNGWQDAVGRPEWQLRKATLLDREVMLLRTAASPLDKETKQSFKFVTGDHRWRDLPPDATNVLPDGQGHYNRALFRQRTGRNLFEFTSAEPLDP